MFHLFQHLETSNTGATSSSEETDSESDLEWIGSASGDLFHKKILRKVVPVVKLQSMNFNSYVDLTCYFENSSLLIN